MKNKIMYGVLILFLVISDLSYVGTLIQGGFIRNDVSNDPANLLFPALFIINIISLILGLIKIKKQRLIALVLIILSLPAIISLIWMSTHKNDFNPLINNLIKSNLVNTRAQIEYNNDQNNNSYSNACEYETVVKLLSEINELKAETKCFSDNDSFVLSAELKKKPNKDDRYYGYNYFCVDSVGSLQSITTQQHNSIINANTLCPEAEELQNIKKQVLSVVESYLRGIGKFDHVKMFTQDEVPYYESSINLDKTTFHISGDRNMVTVDVVIDFKGEIKRWDWNLKKYKDWEPIGSRYYNYKLIRKDGVFQITEGSFFD